MKKIRQMAAIMLVALMAFSSVGIKAKEQPRTADQDVKIEVIHDGEVVESGYNTLTHHRNYVRSTNRTNGDEIVITAPEGVHYLMVQLDEFCGVPKTTGMAQQEQVEGTWRPSDMSSLEYGEALVYLMNDEFRFVIKVNFVFAEVKHNEVNHDNQSCGIVEKIFLYFQHKE